jgi:hypothetical protein
MKFLVWCHDRGYTIDDARTIEADFADEAAQEYAENHSGFNGDPFSCIELSVKADTSDRVQVFEVTVEPIPHFSAHEVRRG